MNNPTRVVTGKNTVFSYLNANEPKSINGSKPKYSASLIISKNDTVTVKKIKAAIQAAYEEGQFKLKGSSKSVPPLSAIKTPLRDGDVEKPDHPEYANAYFINANSVTKPGCVDADLNPILDTSELYSGIIGRASISFYAFNNNGNRGIACGLNNIQKLRDGEHLGGHPDPSLGYTVPVERLREQYLQAKDNPAEQNVFRQLRLCQWVGSTVQWIPDNIFALGAQPIDKKSLEGRDCYGGLDLSSSGDITGLVLMFPPRNENEKYQMLCYAWVPEDTIPQRVQRNGIPYDNWVAEHHMIATPGNVIDYAYIQNTIEELSHRYHIVELAFDRWGSNMLVERLTEMGLTVVPVGQGYKDLSPGSREFYEQMMKGNLIHGNDPVFRWMCGNVVIEQDPAGNIKPTKSKSKDKIDLVVAAIMAMDRCMRHEEHESVYDSRGLLFI